MVRFDVSDDALVTVVPIVAYWVFSGLYELLASFDRYRLHPKSEENAKNIVSKATVLKGMLRQQAVQIAVVMFTLKFISNYSGPPRPKPSCLVAARQLVVAMAVEDAWQYFGHRYMHANRFLFRHVHSTHHNLVAPYAYGALYKNPAEFLILDAAGGALAFLLSGMTPRTAIWFFTFATVKTVDVHCALWMPWNPLQFLFDNNCAYHDVHHQLRGHRFNFAQPFFVAWDKLLGTHMPFVVVERRGGGFEARPMEL